MRLGGLTSVNSAVGIWKKLPSRYPTSFSVRGASTITSRSTTYCSPYPSLVATREAHFRPKQPLKEGAYSFNQFLKMNLPAEEEKRGKRPMPQQQKRNNNNNKKQTGSKKRKTKRERDMSSGSTEEVLAFDIAELRASLEEAESSVEVTNTTTEGGGAAEIVAEEPLPEPGSEIEVKVVELSSTGDALAVQEGSKSKQIYVLSFAVPGDVVKVKAYRHLRDEGYTVADFLSVVQPSPLRDDSRIGCKYFGTCSGCQFQMLDYAEQLRLKRRIVEKAFRNFSDLPPELIPTIGDTIGSPLQYGYRTKLTPHFDGPPGMSRHKSKNKGLFHAERPAIGFMLKGQRRTLDIEDCPIGTDAVRAGMKAERERMEREYAKYSRGSTILLRESTKRVPKASPESAAVVEKPPVMKDGIIDPVKAETDAYVDWKTCITDNNGTSTEYVGDYVFHNPAGSFFQNNNSILPVFTDYVRQHILPADTNATSTSPTQPTSETASKPIKYLIDAYSGSGLFTITLSSLFSQSTGIDISTSSIAFATKNASANDLPWTQANFIAADATELFKSVTYDPDQTVVVLDPPRKGCDSSFLGQLLKFAPRRVVYVSCNVHTQARDVGMLVRGEAGEGVVDESGNGEEKEKEKKRPRYEIESLCGFDFFPQTGHVEGVAVLNRVD
ncbi:uracil-5--methyltransferase [Xylariaceae sp. FL0594]|nr:uracil-5--methyltransferase [Xylariaceae sp. FL0594]